MVFKNNQPVVKKDTNSSKYHRINQIYHMLKNNPHGMSISELASLFNVSTKTIQRDLYEVLSDFGAVKEGRAWKIDPGMAKDSLNTEEKLILGILDEMVKGAGKIFYSKAHALLAQISQQLDSSIFTHTNSEYLEDRALDLFAKVELSVKDKKEIRFDYNGYRFHAKPLKLAFFDGFWYLLAFHIKNNGEEVFKKYHLKSIKNITTLDKKFIIPEILEERLRNANSIWFNLDEQYSVRLFVDKRIKKYFERKPLLTQSILGVDCDGSIEIEIKISDNMEIIPLILYYIPHIKVLEPQSLVDEVENRIKEYLN